MLKVYENLIQFALYPRTAETDECTHAFENKLQSLRNHYFRRTKDAPEGTWTQERALIEQLEDRLIQQKYSGGIKVISSFGDIALRLLWGVFGVDIIAYLFDQEWVPITKIEPFRPSLFLKRLSVLERIAKNLKDGVKTPVWSPETAPYFRPDLGPTLKYFREKHHRLLLECSLRELRAFGEFGQTLRTAIDEPRVDIYMWEPRNFDDAEVKELVLVGLPKRRSLIPRLQGNLCRKQSKARAVEVGCGRLQQLPAICVRTSRVDRHDLTAKKVSCGLSSPTRVRTQRLGRRWPNSSSGDFKRKSSYIHRCFLRPMARGRNCRAGGKSSDANR
jgi:hypothetical protein